jgi:predicted dienelactone hydrolase
MLKEAATGRSGTDPWHPSHPRRPVLALFLGLWAALLCAPPNALEAADLSDQGPFSVETLEFANLSDQPGASSPRDAEPRRLLFRREPVLAPRPQAAPVAQARKIPVKVHVPDHGGPFPVVVVSHGAGGDWDTHAAQARHLASHGYAVLCVEHTGSNRDRMARGFQFMKNLDAMIHDSAEVFARPKDISFAIDRAEEWNRDSAKLRGRLDVRRVGMLGHSFGAFTTMVECGMRPALDWLTPRVEPGRGLGPDVRDARIQCGVALSPQGVGEPFFIRESFGSLKVPLLGISGSRDRQQNGLSAENRREAFAAWPRGPHRFVWLENAGHLDFTDSAGSTRRATPSPTRNDVQPLTRAATLLFFNLHLKGDTEAANQLTENALKAYLRGAVPRVEVLSK